MSPEEEYQAQADFWEWVDSQWKQEYDRTGLQAIAYDTPILAKGYPIKRRKKRAD
jgi:hypothetical protein